METVTVTKLHRSPGKYIELAEKGKTFLITKNGKSIVALQPFQSYLDQQVELASAVYEIVLLRAITKKKRR